MYQSQTILLKLKQLTVIIWLIVCKVLHQHAVTRHADVRHVFKTVEFLRVNNIVIHMGLIFAASLRLLFWIFFFFYFILCNLLDLKVTCF